METFWCHELWFQQPYYKGIRLKSGEGKSKIEEQTQIIISRIRKKKIVEKRGQINELLHLHINSFNSN